MGHIYYIKWVTTEYVPHWGTKVGHIYFYIILCIQLYRTGARQTEITLVEFHCMINIAVEHWTYKSGSHGIKVGHIYYIKWVTTEYVPHWGTKVGHIYFYIILCIQLYRTGARQTEITLVEFHCMINIAVEHWTYKSVAIDSKVWHIYYIKCGTKNMCHSVAQKCGTKVWHNWFT